MKKSKTSILLGGFNKEQNGSIPTISEIIFQNLNSQFNIEKFYAVRSRNMKPARINFSNIFAFIIEYSKWIIKCFRLPDIVHYPVTSYWNFEKSMLFLITSKIFRSKTVGHLHGGYFINFWDSLGSTRKRIAIKLIKQLDSLIVLSEYWKTSLIERGIIDSQKIFIVNNPIEKDFETIAKEKSNGIIKILSVGVLMKSKGIYEILECANRFRDSSNVKFIIMGEEKEKNLLKYCLDYKRKNSLKNIEFVGNQKGVNKMEYFKNADVLYHPSYYENFPLTIIEAAASRMAIVSTEKGAVTEFFKDNDSIMYIKEGNVENQYEVIKSVVDNRAKIDLLGEKANEIYNEKLDTKQIIEKFKNVYGQICQ